MPKKKNELDFAQGFAELEEITQWFESGSRIWIRVWKNLNAPPSWPKFYAPG